MDGFYMHNDLNFPQVLILHIGMLKTWEMKNNLVIK
jgi:hypothetical protein